MNSNYFICILFIDKHKVFLEMETNKVVRNNNFNHSTNTPFNKANKQTITTCTSEQNLISLQKQQK